MDIKSPVLLKIKAALFVIIGVTCAVLILIPDFSWRAFALFAIAIWAFCRAYYFCFYVIQYYIDPGFRYAGLFDSLLYLIGLKKKPMP